MVLKDARPHLNSDSVWYIPEGAWLGNCITSPLWIMGKGKFQWSFTGTGALLQRRRLGRKAFIGGSSWALLTSHVHERKCSEKRVAWGIWSGFWLMGSLPGTVVWEGKNKPDCQALGKMMQLVTHKKVIILFFCFVAGIFFFLSFKSKTNPKSSRSDLSLSLSLFFSYLLFHANISELVDRSLKIMWKDSVEAQRQLRLFQLEEFSKLFFLTEAMGDGRWWMASCLSKQKLWDLLRCWKAHTAEVRSCPCALTSYFLWTEKLLLFGATCRKRECRQAVLVDGTLVLFWVGRWGHWGCQISDQSQELQVFDSQNHHWE